MRLHQCTNICITGDPEEEEKKGQNIKEIRAKNVSNLTKYMNLQIQEAQ